MKEIVSNRAFFSNAGKPARKPLRTFKEMAEEFGVSEGAFAAALKDENSPRAELHHFAKHSGNNRWYEPIAMRKWWKFRAERLGSPA